MLVPLLLLLPLVYSASLAGPNVQPQVAGSSYKAQDPECSFGWIYYPANQKCYWISTGQRSFNASATWCADNGGQLAIIRNEQENTWLASASKTPGRLPAWIGLSCDASSNCQWTDNTPLTGYSNWRQNNPIKWAMGVNLEPSDSSKPFVWSSGSFSSELMFICEMNKK